MILWSGPIYDQSGYGEVSRDYVMSLYGAGADIRTAPVSYSEGKVTHDFYKKLELKQKVDGNNILYINHCTPDIAIPYNGARKNILYTVWETRQAPKSFYKRLREFDFIMTPSQFSKDSLTVTGDLDVRIVPHIIKSYGDYPYPKVYEQLKDKVIYFSNFEWHIGKGYDILLEGFVKAFNSKSDVALVIKTYNLSLKSWKQSAINYIKRIKDLHGFTGSIILLPSYISRENLLSLYQHCNYYISTSRREGFSLTCAEAYSFNKTIIAPNLGGHREFLNENNSLLFESNFEKIKDVEFDRSNYLGLEWVEPDLDSFIDTLRLTYDKEIKFDCKIEDKFKPSEVAKQILGMLP